MEGAIAERWLSQVQLRLWLRRFLVLVVNPALVVYVIVAADSDGVAFEVAQQWSIIAALMSQFSIVWQLLVRPQTVVKHLSVQTMGILAAGHVFRFAFEQGSSAGTAEILPGLALSGLAGALAVLSLLGFILALAHHRQAATGASADDPILVLCGAAFGAEAVRRWQGPALTAARLRRPPGLVAWLAAALEHLLLPLLAALVALLLEGLMAALGRETSARDVCALGGAALLALALLPQLRVLLALRREHCEAQVPPELRYWLTSSAFGHFVSFVTALPDALRSRGASSAHSVVLVCGEGFNAAVLVELLVAHFYAKCTGKDMVLPA